MEGTGKTTMVRVQKERAGENRNSDGSKSPGLYQNHINHAPPPGNARLGNSSVRDLSEPELNRLFPSLFLQKKLNGCNPTNFSEAKNKLF
jgi:hypothetical protein